MADYSDTLGLIAGARERRPMRSLPVLDALFRRLAICTRHEDAIATEDRIWDLWMYHPHRAATEMLEAATRDIAAKRYDIAETRLAILLRGAPAFAEAWNKRAALYYLLGRDEDAIRDLSRTLELEPRHFGAILHVAEILLGSGDPDGAYFAFARALALHPHLERAREAVAEHQRKNRQ